MAEVVVSPSLTADFLAMQALARRPVQSARELTDNLNEICHAVYHADLNRYDLAEVKRSAPDLIAAIFTLKLEVRNQIAAWRAQGFMTHEAQKAIRDVFRYARYITDMLGELAGGNQRLGPKDDPAPAFTGGPLNTLFNPAVHAGGQMKFRSGDVLLFRGRIHNSAAIARIGDVDSQFSHIAMAHIDPSAGEWLVEALIESGSVITPLARALGHHNGRVAAFRYKDAGLASRASQRIYDKVKETVEGKAPHIYYDFTMQLDGYKELFCAKLVRCAFDLASGGKVKPPAFCTKLDMKNRDFFRRIGVTAVDTFAPGDMEIDPDFDFVAEWRDYRLTSELRLKDMIMTKLFEWMDAYDYKFHEDFTIWLIGIFGRLSSHLSEKAKDAIASVVPKVPDNMSRSAIAAVAMLHKTAEPIFLKMEQLEIQSIAKTGRQLHPRDVFAALEEHRLESKGRIGYLRGRA